MQVAIRRISLKSLSGMGCLLGVIAAFLPSVLGGLLIVGLADLLRRWLESWQEVNVSLLGQEIAHLNFVRLLGLEQALELLQTLGAASAPVLFLIVLAVALAGGALLTVTVVVAGLAYNLLAQATGGVIVEMEAVGKRERKR